MRTITYLQQEYKVIFIICMKNESGFKENLDKKQNNRRLVKRNYHTNLQKRDQKQCGNYGGITLLCQTIKIYDRTLLYKMIKEIKVKLAELYVFREETVTTGLILKQDL
jgi:hypothetical protein